MGHFFSFLNKNIPVEFWDKIQIFFTLCSLLVSFFHPWFVLSNIPNLDFPCILLCFILLSLPNWFFRDRSFTSSPSKRSSKSLQRINWGLHLKYWRKITCLVCTNSDILIICWLTESMIDIFQWFQHQCFPTVCWPYEWMKWNEMNEIKYIKWKQWDSNSQPLCL